MLGTEANNGSQSPSISGDGRYALFYTSSGLLVGDDFNTFSDVYRALNAPLP